MKKKKNLYTVISEIQGSTFIEQFYAVDLKNLLDVWLSGTISHIVSKSPSETDYDFTPIQNTKHVWATSLVDDNDVFVLLYAILTMDKSRNADYVSVNQGD